MQLFLYRDTKDETIHASGNQKVTGCRVKLKNATQFTHAGVEDFSDLMAFLDRVNCQKCQDYFTPKILKADVKAMKQKLKAEKKGETYRDDPITPEPEQKRKQTPEPVYSAPPPPPAPAPMPEPEPEQKPEPVPAVQAPELDDSALPQYEEWVPPSKKKEQVPPPSTNNFSIDDSLAQFMLGKQEDPTAAAFASDNSKNPNVLAEQQEVEKATGMMDDTLAQFAIPGANTPKPAPVPATEQTSGLVDDTLAQFAIPGMNATKPAPAPAMEQMSDLVDDALAQFAIPGGNSPDPVPAMQSMNAIEEPSEQTAPKPVQPTGINDILAEYGQKPLEKEEETLEELLAKFKEEKKQNAQQVQTNMQEIADLSDLGNLEVPQLKAPSAKATQVPVSAAASPIAKPAPVVSKHAELIGELDEIAMAPKEENREEEEDEYMSRVVNTRLEDYDDDDDDDDYDDDYYDDDDEEEYHGSSYAPSDDDEDYSIDEAEESDEVEDEDEYEDYETSEEEIDYEKPVKIAGKASQVTAEDIQAATAAITAAAAAITAAAAKAPASVPDLDLPDLSGLGIPDVPQLNIPEVPHLNIPDVPTVPDVPDLSDLPSISDIPSNPFEADANADIPEVPTLSNDEPDYMDSLQSPMSMNPMGYQPVYQQPIYTQPPVYNQPPVYPQQPVSGYPQSPPPPVYTPPHTPAAHTAVPYENPPANSMQFQQMQQPVPPPRQPVSQGVRVSTIGQNTTVPDAVRNAIAKTAAQSNENIFDQQGKKVHVATDIASALNQIGVDTSSYNKPQKEENEPVVQGYKEWKPREDKKLANFKKGLNKKF